MPTFVNRTTVFNLETMLTQKVRSEFIGRGRYRSAREHRRRRGADRRSTAVTIAPASFTAQQLASRYVITMAAHVELRD